MNKNHLLKLSILQAVVLAFIVSCGGGSGDSSSASSSSSLFPRFSAQKLETDLGQGASASGASANQAAVIASLTAATNSLDAITNADASDGHQGGNYPPADQDMPGDQLSSCERQESSSTGLKDQVGGKGKVLACQLDEMLKSIEKLISDNGFKADTTADVTHAQKHYLTFSFTGANVKLVETSSSDLYYQYAILDATTGKKALRLVGDPTTDGASDGISAMPMNFDIVWSTTPKFLRAVIVQTIFSESDADVSVDTGTYIYARQNADENFEYKFDMYVNMPDKYLASQLGPQSGGGTATEIDLPKRALLSIAYDATGNFQLLEHEIKRYATTLDVAGIAVDATSAGSDDATISYFDATASMMISGNTKNYKAVFSESDYTPIIDDTTIAIHKDATKAAMCGAGYSNSDVSADFNPTGDAKCTGFDPDTYKDDSNFDVTTAVKNKGDVPSYIEDRDSFDDAYGDSGAPTEPDDEIGDDFDMHKWPEESSSDDSCPPTDPGYPYCGHGASLAPSVSEFLVQISHPAQLKFTPKI